MKAKLNGILKYARKLKRFQEGGVTFFEAPTKYNPEEDFYMKNAYARYNASQKPTKGSKAKEPKAIEGKYLTDGPKGTRDHYNGVISRAVSDYRQQLMAGGEGWGTGAEGMAAADRTKRIVAEATAANSTLKKDRDSFLKDLTDNDRTSVAYIKGNYFAENTETGVIDGVSAEDYMANPEKYRKFTVDEAIRYADDHPQRSSAIYQSLGSISAGNKFIKENITKEKAVANGVALTSTELNKAYQTLSETGDFTDKAVSSGVDQIVRNQANSIMENSAARDNIMRRVYEDPSYVASIMKAENKTLAKTNAIKAEIFSLIYMHGTAKGSSGGSGGSGDGDPNGGKKFNLGGAALELEATGFGQKETKSLTTTDMASHMSEGDDEFLKIYGGSRVIETKKEIQKINQTALNDPKGNKSSNLASVQAFSDLTSVDFDKIYGVDGLSISGKNGIFENSNAAKNNLVFTGGDMARISMPSWPDGSPMTGMGTFLTEFKEKMDGMDGIGSDLSLADATTLHESNKKTALEYIKKHGSEEAKVIAQYLMQLDGGTVQTSNKLAAETYAYVDSSKIEDYPGAKPVDDDDEKERYFKQNPSVKQDRFETFSSKTLVKIPVYIDFSPPVDIINKIKASLNNDARNTMIDQTTRSMTMHEILSQVSPTPTQ